MDCIDLGNLLPLAVIGGGFGFVGTVLYGTWLLGRYRGREDRPPAVSDAEGRLRRLEEAMGEVTDAVDRLEAAHRFTARLLTERAGDRSAEGGRPPHRVTTPH